MLNFECSNEEGLLCSAGANVNINRIQTDRCSMQVDPCLIEAKFRIALNYDQISWSQLVALYSYYVRQLR